MTKTRAIFKITLPMPPTDNNIYTHTIMKIGGRAIPVKQLSNKARAYQNRVRPIITEAAISQNIDMPTNVEYMCVVKVYFEKVYNAGWPKTAKSRYKKEDAQNRIKLATDTVSEIIGIDDSHHFLTIIKKFEDKENPRIEMKIEERIKQGG